MLNALKNIVLDLGTHMLAWRQKKIEGHWEGTQFKAQSDKDAHDFLIHHITALFPNIPIVSEENEDNHQDKRFDKYFLIDPIDGTASFAGGFDGFVTQLAYIDNNNVLLGIVYAPAKKELFWAEKNKGAYLNDKKLDVTKRNNSIILIDNYPEPKGIAEKIYHGLPCDSYVECGSLGLKICKIADKTANLFVKDVLLKDWDVAPADLILTEAGGYFSRLDGTDYHYDGSYYKQGILATTHTDLSERVVTYLEDNKQ